PQIPAQQPYAPAAQQEPDPYAYQQQDQYAYQQQYAQPDPYGYQQQDPYGYQQGYEQPQYEAPAALEEASLFDTGMITAEQLRQYEQGR
ncbi:cell division initiation protein, partial [Streptomyces sp. MZ04]